jgi:hypothetical protein
MKICTAILTYDTPLYNHFDSIKRTYLKNKNEDFYFVYNGIDESKQDLKNNNINYYSDIVHPSGIPVMFLKFMNLIEQGVFEDYDFVIRVNSSTFINTDIIRKKLTYFDKNVYMGFFEPSWNFVSGACIIFSQDVLKKLLDYKNKINIFKEDDVVIGQIMEMTNTPKNFLERYCLHGLNSVPSTKEITKGLLYPQIRICNYANRNLIDVKIWDTLATTLNL